MAKALFLSLPLTGHINPSLSLVHELVGRGDEVVYYATGAFAARIEQAQARYRPYRNAFLTGMMHLPERMHELSWLLMRTTAELLSEQLEEFRAQRPDYVITDSVAPWGQWVAEILDVPVVTSVSTFAFNRRVLAFAAARGILPRSARLFASKLRHIVNALRLGRELRLRYAVRGPGIRGLVAAHSNLNIVYTSHHFQPCAESFDDRFQFVGPSLRDRRETADFPWEQVRDCLRVTGHTVQHGRHILPELLSGIPGPGFASDHVGGNECIQRKLGTGTTELHSAIGGTATERAPARRRIHHARRDE